MKTFEQSRRFCRDCLILPHAQEESDQGTSFTETQTLLRLPGTLPQRGERKIIQPRGLEKRS